MADTNDIMSGIVSALKSVLKLILGMLVRLKHFLGRLFIDRWMRDIVAWYDRRHPDSSRRKKGEDSDYVRQLNGRIDQLVTSYSSLQETMAQEREINENLTTKISGLRGELENCRRQSEQDSMKISELRQEVENLSLQNSHLMSRCLPESEIPSMIYYAQGDATGLTLRKVSATPTGEHTYRLQTLQGDSSTATFEPDIRHNAPDVIANRNTTLIACAIVGIASNPSSVKVVSPGRAERINNKWTVITKAKIELI